MDNWKPTNPKDVVGMKKVSFSCLSWPVIGEMAVGMHEGALKYGRTNYRDEGVAASTYFDSTLRHITDWYEGEDIDPKSGMNHITKALTSLMVLRDAMLNDLVTDDRPIRVRDTHWMDHLNEKTEKLVALYPNPKRPFTEKPLERKFRASAFPSGLPEEAKLPFEDAT